MAASAATRPLTLAVALALCFPPAALAQAVNPQAIHGGVSVVQNGSLTVVTTQNGAGTSHSAINWQSFGVPAGSTTWFAQPGALSTSINRVTGPDPSLILGTLGSNGRLVLVNPAGIAVGARAAVDTAGFTASTLSMSPADAIAGRLRFGSDGASAGGALSVHGQVVARSGDVVLIAPQLETGANAVVESVGGDTILAAGRQVELTGRGLEGIRLQIQAPGDSAVNLGTLKGDSVGVFASQLRHSGVIQAGSASVVGGRVVLRGRESVEISGRISAKAGDMGGSVQVTADSLVLRAATSIDVSGLLGGGELRIGGGRQGKDASIPNARTVDVETGVQLRADAQLSGPGGSIVVWADDRNRFAGALSARGAGDGDGGNAEVSGKQQLSFRGSADLGSDRGKTGELLLDPATVTIQGGSCPLLGCLFTGVLSAIDLGPTTIYENELEGMNANVTVQASQQITASGSFGGGELMMRPNVDLKLEVTGSGAGGINVVGMPIRTQGTGKVELLTTGAAQDIRTDDIRSESGGIRINAANGAVSLGSATLRTSGSQIVIGGNASVGAGITLSGTTFDSGGGSITLTSPNGIVANGVTIASSSGSTLLDGGSSGSVDFSGATRLDSSVTARGFAVTNAGQLTLGGQVVTLSTAGSPFSNQIGGTVAGSGTIDVGSSTFSNAGTLSPGGAGAIGQLTVQGNLQQAPTARTVMDVAGASSADRLVVSRNASLDGNLAVNASSYAPAATDSYPLVQAASLSGSFASVTAPAFTGFVPAYLASRMDFAQPPGPTPAPSPAPVVLPPAAPPPAPYVNINGGSPGATTLPVNCMLTATCAPPPPPSVPAAAPVPVPVPGAALPPLPTAAPVALPAPAPGPGAAPAIVPVPLPAAVPTASIAPPPVTAAPLPGPFFNAPAVGAALQEQGAQLAAFLGRPPVPSGLAASPRSKEQDQDAVAAAETQCVAIGSMAPSRLPLSVIRPDVDWWRR